MDIKVSQKEQMYQPTGAVDVITSGINDFFLIEEDEYNTKEMILHLPLETDALDISGNSNDGTPTDIIYSDKPDMKMYLPLVSDALDISGNGNNGTATDITWEGGVANFNGTSSEISDSIVFNNFLQTCFYFTADIDIPSSAATYVIKIADASHLFRLDVNESGAFDLVIVNSGVEYGVGSFWIIPTDGFAHKYFLKIINQTSVELYIDNISQGIKTFSSKVIFNFTTSIFSIGLGDVVGLSGTMSKLYGFNRALTDAERTDLYTDGTFLPLDKAVACFNGVSSRISVSIPHSAYTSLSHCFKITNTSASSIERILLNYGESPFLDGGIGYYQSGLDVVFEFLSVGGTFYTTTCSGIIDSGIETEISIIFNSGNLKIYKNNVIVKDVET